MLLAAEEVDAATSRLDCFGLAILSHGDNDVVFGTDDIISINKLIEPIKGCKNLVGKPKIFIIQVELHKICC
jgi:hypothetical protein